MQSTYRTTWERYVSAWKASSSHEKQTLFADALSPECIYTDPLAQTHGYEALLQYMLEFHQQIPGGHFVTQKFMEHHNQSVAVWTMHAGDGTTLGDGISVAEYDEQGKLRAMTGFFESPTS